MINLFKRFGQGIVYVLTFPVFLVFLILFAIYGLFIMLIETIKFIYNFFTGRNIKGELPEDVAAKKIIDANNPLKQQELQEEAERERLKEEAKAEALKKEESQPAPIKEEPSPFIPLKEVGPVEEEKVPIQEEPIVKEEPLNDLSSIAFVEEEEPAKEEDVFETIISETNIEKEKQPETNVDVIEEEEEIEVYRPRGKEDEDLQDESDDDKSNDSFDGIDISYQ